MAEHIDVEAGVTEALDALAARPQRGERGRFVAGNTEAGTTLARSESLFIRMAELRGPITPKGKARALYSAYLSALDREHRLATTLGLERHARQIDLARTLAEQQR